MKRLIAASISLALIFFLISIFFAALSFVIYTRLSDEKPIATVYFQKEDQNEFRAYFIEEDNNKVAEYKIYGNQWRIDAQFIKIVPWANVFGLDAQYSLERFEGRYENIDNENTQPHIAYDLGGGGFTLPQFLIDYNILIDAEYGSSSYTTIDVEKLYTVFRTQSGIIIRQKSTSEITDYDEEILDFIKNNIIDW